MRVAVRLTSGEELVGTIIEKFEDGIWLKRERHVSWLAFEIIESIDSITKGGHVFSKKQFGR